MTATTLELLNYWRRDGRAFRFFFAQLEAVETIIFLNEARRDYLQGIDVPRDEPSDKQKAERGYKAFRRYACKMATGSGKTTVMGMLAAWSILNKVHDRSNARYSDVVLVVCPNVTIRSRLAELDPKLGDASLYRKADLVPPHLMPDLTQGRVLVTNWHVFEPQTSQAGGVSGRVVKAGRRETVPEIIHIGPKTTTARGRRYLTSEEYSRQASLGMIEVIDEEKDNDGNVKYARVTRDRYVESDTALVNRILGREVGGKQNILVLNDEAHHAYRIRKDEPDEEEEDLLGEEGEADEFYKEATVWVDGLDRVQKLRGINFCVDLSATPYFLGRVGQDTNRPFPVGGQRLSAHRRDRVRPREDSAARGSRHDRRRDSRLLQHLALDSAAAHARRARRQEGLAEARGDPEVGEHAHLDAGRLVGRVARRVGAVEGRPAAAGLHHRLQEHRDREGGLRVARREQAADGHSVVEDRRLSATPTAASTRFAWTRKSSARPTPATRRATRSSGCGSRSTRLAEPTGRAISRAGRSIRRDSRSWRRSAGGRCIRRGATSAASSRWGC